MSFYMKNLSRGEGALSRDGEGIFFPMSNAPDVETYFQKNRKNIHTYVQYFGVPRTIPDRSSSSASKMLQQPVVGVASNATSSSSTTALNYQNNIMEEQSSKAYCTRTNKGGGDHRNSKEDEVPDRVLLGAHDLQVEGYINSDQKQQKHASSSSRSPPRQFLNYAGGASSCTSSRIPEETPSESGGLGVQDQMVVDEWRAGLRNRGNTCYLNALLQALHACAPFRRLVTHDNWTVAPSSQKNVSQKREMKNDTSEGNAAHDLDVDNGKPRYDQLQHDIFGQHDNLPGGTIFSNKQMNPGGGQHQSCDTSTEAMNIPFQLQRLFLQLSYSNDGNGIDTGPLLRSFGPGFSAADQHDVSEMCRVFLQALGDSASRLSAGIESLFGIDSTSVLEEIPSPQRTEPLVQLQLSEYENNKEKVDLTFSSAPSTSGGSRVFVDKEQHENAPPAAFSSNQNHALSARRRERNEWALDLSLPVISSFEAGVPQLHPDFDACVRALKARETMTGADQWEAEPGVRVNAAKYTDFKGPLPKILACHLLSFYYDTTTGTRCKVDLFEARRNKSRELRGRGASYHARRRGATLHTPTSAVVDYSVFGNCGTATPAASLAAASPACISSPSAQNASFSPSGRGRWHSIPLIYDFERALEIKYDSDTVLTDAVQKSKKLNDAVKSFYENDMGREGSNTSTTASGFGGGPLSSLYSSSSDDADADSFAESRSAVQTTSCFLPPKNSSRAGPCQGDSASTVVDESFSGASTSSSGEALPEVPSSCGPGRAPASTSENKPPYMLRAVCFHQGSTSFGGHYVACVRSGQDWFLCNDIRKEKILGVSNSGPDFSSGEYGTPYFLLYELMDPNNPVEDEEEDLHLRVNTMLHEAEVAEAQRTQVGLHEEEHSGYSLQPATERSHVHAVQAVGGNNSWEAIVRNIQAENRLRREAELLCNLSRQALKIRVYSASSQEMHMHASMQQYMLDTSTSFATRLDHGGGGANYLPRNNDLLVQMAGGGLPNSNTRGHVDNVMDDQLPEQPIRLTGCLVSDFSLSDSPATMLFARDSGALPGESGPSCGLFPSIQKEERDPFPAHRELSSSAFGALPFVPRFSLAEADVVVAEHDKLIKNEGAPRLLDKFVTARTDPHPRGGTGCSNIIGIPSTGVDALAGHVLAGKSVLVDDLDMEGTTSEDFGAETEEDDYEMETVPSPCGSSSVTEYAFKFSRQTTGTSVTQQQQHTKDQHDHADVVVDDHQEYHDQHLQLGSKNDAPANMIAPESRRNHPGVMTTTDHITGRAVVPLPKARRGEEYQQMTLLDVPRFVRDHRLRGYDPSTGIVSPIDFGSFSAGQNERAGTSSALGQQYSGTTGATRGTIPSNYMNAECGVTQSGSVCVALVNLATSFKGRKNGFEQLPSPSLARGDSSAYTVERVGMFLPSGDLVENIQAFFFGSQSPESKSSKRYFQGSGSCATTRAPATIKAVDNIMLTGGRAAESAPGASSIDAASSTSFPTWSTANFVLLVRKNEVAHSDVDGRTSRRAFSIDSCATGASSVSCMATEACSALSVPSSTWKLITPAHLLDTLLHQGGPGRSVERQQTGCTSAGC
ncbi:unnamed protein product, partial [Amoebophrya sp. A25]|eukprot:GSA25T00010540001.1